MWVYIPYVRLPSAYQEVEYIQSSGTQYINTGYKPTIYDTIETKFTTAASTSDTNLYWSRYNSSYNRQDFTIWINTSSSKWIACHYPYWSSNNQTTDTGWFFTSDIINTPRVLKITPQYCYVDGEIKYTFNVSRTSYTPSYNAYLFAKNENNSVSKNWSFKIYYFKVSSNWTPQREFIPCYRKSDNVIWMYDIVNNQFYTNSWTGTFSKWADVTAVPLKNAYLGGVYEETYTVPTSSTRQLIGKEWWKIQQVVMELAWTGNSSWNSAELFMKIYNKHPNNQTITADFGGALLFWSQWASSNAGKFYSDTPDVTIFISFPSSATTNTKWAYMLTINSDGTGNLKVWQTYWTWLYNQDFNLTTAQMSRITEVFNSQDAVVSKTVWSNVTSVTVNKITVTYTK